MSKFTDMSRKELIEEAKTAGLDVMFKEAGKVLNSSKTEDIIKALESDGASIIKVEKKPKVKSMAVVATPELIVEDSMRLTKVIVNDTITSQTTAGRSEGTMLEIGWGNNSGTFTERINLDGNVQGVSQAGIGRLKEITKVEFITDSTGKSKPVTLPRFQVKEVGGWTEQEIEALKQKQKTRM